MRYQICGAAHGPQTWDPGAGTVDTVVRLSSVPLKRLPIAAPSYDRGSVSVGIAHIGAGHFHRAHQAMYIDRLLRAGLGAASGASAGSG